MDDHVATGSRRRHLPGIQRVAGNPLHALFGPMKLGAALQRPNLPVVRRQPTRHFPAYAPACSQNQDFAAAVHRLSPFANGCLTAYLRLISNEIAYHHRAAIHFCMNTSIPWEWYRTFLAVLQEGSLSGASRTLNITQPTAGRHIAGLEAALGQALFTRSQTGLLATDAALALQAHAEAMDNTARALERTAANFSRNSTDLRGVVRVAASEVVGAEVLPPLIARLRQACPSIVIELMLSNRFQDLLHREADIAVRMVAPQQEQLIARRLGRIELGLHATDAYLIRQGRPATPEELDGHALIGFDSATPLVRRALARYPRFQREVFAMRTDSDLAQLSLIRAGAGIGICQAPLADGIIPLQRVLAADFSLYLDTWLVMHEDLRHSPACKRVFNFLAEGLQTYIRGPLAR